MSETKQKSKFEELAAIDVSKKIEKKNGLSYLSWAWALDTLLRADPDAKWEYGEPKLYGETMMVYCTVTAFGKDRTAHLPVMDHRNKPIAHPDAFQVNTAMQRALVKAIALHGLGLYIYAGEDLPPADGEPEKVKDITANPRKLAWDNLTDEEQKEVQNVADCIIAEFERSGAQAALDLAAENTIGWPERSEHLKPALLSRLPKEVTGGWNKLTKKAA